MGQGAMSLSAKVIADSPMCSSLNQVCHTYICFSVWCCPYPWGPPWRSWWQSFPWNGPIPNFATNVLETSAWTLCVGYDHEDVVMVAVLLGLGDAISMVAVYLEFVYCPNGILTPKKNTSNLSFCFCSSCVLAKKSWPCVSECWRHCILQIGCDAWGTNSGTGLCE